MGCLLPEPETIQNAGSWFVMGNAFCLKELSRMLPATKRMGSWHCSLCEHLLVICKVIVLSPFKSFLESSLCFTASKKVMAGRGNKPSCCPQKTQNHSGPCLACTHRLPSLQLALSWRAGCEHRAGWEREADSKEQKKARLDLEGVGLLTSCTWQRSLEMENDSLIN